MKTRIKSYFCTRNQKEKFDLKKLYYKTQINTKWQTKQIPQAIFLRLS